jgi:hypothetical protein
MVNISSQYSQQRSITRYKVTNNKLHTKLHTCLDLNRLLITVIDRLYTDELQTWEEKKVYRLFV